MRNIGFGNGRIAIGNGSCLFIEREIAAFHSIFHFPTVFTAVVSGCRFPGISFVSALTYPITTVRMRRFVLRTAVSMLLCDGHVTCILQPQLHILSLMICTNFIHNAAITHNGIARRIRSRAITKICKACRICRIAIQIDHARRELDFTSAINCLLNGQSRIRCHCSAAIRWCTWPLNILDISIIPAVQILAPCIVSLISVRRSRQSALKHSKTIAVFLNNNLAMPPAIPAMKIFTAANPKRRTKRSI